MVQVSAAEARGRLPELLAAAEGGEGVEIRAENGRTFRLIPTRTRPPVTGVPRAGSCQGLIEVPDDWDAPLDELREYMG
jgi:antitoxin (DNA-binding transcriptional repressor) of toxin-antitoxin stability system